MSAPCTTPWAGVRRGFQDSVCSWQITQSPLPSSSSSLYCEILKTDLITYFIVVYIHRHRKPRPRPRLYDSFLEEVPRVTRFMAQEVEWWSPRERGWRLGCLREREISFCKTKKSSGDGFAQSRDYA